MVCPGPWAPPGVGDSQHLCTQSCSHLSLAPCSVVKWANGSCAPEAQASNWKGAKGLLKISEYSEESSVLFDQFTGKGISLESLFMTKIIIWWWSLNKDLTVASQKINEMLLCFVPLTASTAAFAPPVELSPSEGTCYTTAAPASGKQHLAKNSQVKLDVKTNALTTCKQFLLFVNVNFRMSVESFVSTKLCRWVSFWDRGGTWWWQCDQ